jgi:hypothetical protein
MFLFCTDYSSLKLIDAFNQLAHNTFPDFRLRSKMASFPWKPAAWHPRFIFPSTAIQGVYRHYFLKLQADLARIFHKPRFLPG